MRGCPSSSSSRVEPERADATMAEPEEPISTQQGKQEEEYDRFGFHLGSEESSEWTPKERKLYLRKLQERELKWIKMMQNWDVYTTSKHVKLIRRCRKGIPDSVRGTAWAKLLSAHELKGASDKEMLLFRTMLPEPRSKLASFFDVIEKDLHRTFPSHEMFVTRGGGGQEDLSDVLRTYAYCHPTPGYCQGMGMIAAVLLMYQLKEDAYKCFCQLLRQAFIPSCHKKEKYMLGVFSDGLERVKAYTTALDILVKRNMPRVGNHLELHCMSGILYSVDWFMCNFAKTLAWDVVLRIWDMFIQQGYHVLVRVAFEIVKLLSKQLLQDCKDMQDVMTMLRTAPRKVATPQTLLPALLQSKITDEGIDAALLEAGYVKKEDVLEPTLTLPKDESVVQAQEQEQEQEQEEEHEDAVTQNQDQPQQAMHTAHVGQQPEPDQVVAAHAEQAHHVAAIDVDSELEAQAQSADRRESLSMSDHSKEHESSSEDWV